MLSSPIVGAGLTKDVGPVAVPECAPVVVVFAVALLVVVTLAPLPFSHQGLVVVECWPGGVFNGSLQDVQN